MKIDLDKIVIFLVRVRAKKRVFVNGDFPVGEASGFEFVKKPGVISGIVFFSNSMSMLSGKDFRFDQFEEIIDFLADVKSDGTVLECAVSGGSYMYMPPVGGLFAL